MSEQQKSSATTVGDAAGPDTAFAMALLWVIPVIALLLSLLRF